MKKFIVLIITFSAALLPAGAQPDGKQLWESANSAYMNGDYRTAVLLYDSIVSSGYSGYKVYYNLGNAWFKEGNIGKAVLNYRIAERLAPSDSDIKHNLAVANAHVKDKIEKVPVFFLKRWTSALRHSAGSNFWAWMSLAMFTLATCGTLAYLLGVRLPVRKAGFFTALASFVLFVATGAFAVISRSELLNPDIAVVMAGAVPVKSSPESNSKDIFILHEGTTVRVTATLGTWSEIVIDDGNKGWIYSSAIELLK